MKKTRIDYFWMTIPRLRGRQRTARGHLSLVALMIIGFALIPLGLFGYEATMAREQFNQLQAATDAAALAAATFLNGPQNIDLDSTTQNIGLHYFQLNRVSLSSLSTAAQVDDALKESPEAGKSAFTLTIDKDAKTVTAKSAFGLKPSILSFLGVFPLHAISVAGPGRSTLGDVCLVFDLSGSMFYGTQRNRAVYYQRHYIRPRLALETVTDSVTVKDFKADGTPIDSLSSPVVTPSVTSTPVVDKDYALPFNSDETLASQTSDGPIVKKNDGSGDYSITETTTHIIRHHTAAYLYYTYTPCSNYDDSNPGTWFQNSNTGEMPNWGFYIAPEFKDANIHVIPEPSEVTVDYSGGTDTSDGALECIDGNTPLMLAAMKAVDNLSSMPINPFTMRQFTKDELKTAVQLSLLIEGKSRNLEDAASYANKYHANRSALKFINFVPSGGYLAEYQRIALTVPEPLHHEARMVHKFIDWADQQGWDVHWSLVGFGGYAPHDPAVPTVDGPSVDLTPFTAKSVFQSGDAAPTYAEVADYAFPEVSLSTSNSNAQLVKDAVDVATVSSGTSTGHALQEARAQLKAGHRPGRTKTIILLTDGVPTDTGSGAQAQLMAKEGIRLIIVGYFEIEGVCEPHGNLDSGPVWVQVMKKKAGSQARAFAFGGCNKVPNGIAPARLQLLEDQIFTWLKENVVTSDSIALR
jgi:hypothetical protein